MAQNSIAREVTFEAEPGAAISLELDLDRAPLDPREPPRLVTGAVPRMGTVGIRGPEPVVCPYCGASGWATDRRGACCMRCGAPLGSTLAPPAPALQSPAPSVSEAVIEAATSLPFGFWKRVPAYAFLALVLGNGCRCGGLPTVTNVSLAVLVVIGLAGVVLCLQRNP